MNPFEYTVYLIGWGAIGWFIGWLIDSVRR